MVLLFDEESSIKKLPWKPKDGELYFSGRMDGGIIRQYWNGNHYDYALYFVGNCFRTSEDAKHASKIVDKLRRKYEGGGE